jgi:hypothetical protein
MDLFQISGFATVCQVSGVTDPVKSFWKDMEQEQMDEIFTADRARFYYAVVRVILIAECYIPIRYGQDSCIGYGTAV